MFRRFVHVQYGATQASVPSSRAHHSSRVRASRCRAAAPQFGPLGSVPLGPEIRIRSACLFQEQGVELGFDGADGNVSAVGAAVRIVEVGAAVQQVATPCLLPLAHGLEGVHHGHEQVEPSFRFEESRVKHHPLPMIFTLSS